MKNSKRLRISYNAPAILSFVLICFAVQLLNVLTKGASNRAVFSVYRSSFLDPLAYLRCVCHVFGHANWNHLMGNMMYILILGPMLEEKYGTSNMVFIMLVTALATGLANLIFFPNIRLLGASGIVFAMILLSSITITEEHTIRFRSFLLPRFTSGSRRIKGFSRRITSRRWRISWVA